MSRLLLAVLVAASRRGRRVASGSPPRPAAVPHRIVSLSPTATESLFAIGAGPQVIAVDDQSDYPKSGARARRSPASRRTSRRSPATSPTSSIVAYDPNGLVADAAQARDPRAASRTRPRRLAGTRTRRSTTLGKVTGQRRQATARGRADEDADRVALVEAARRAPAADASTTSSAPTYYSATSEHVHRPGLQRSSGCKNIADAADIDGQRRLSEALGRVRRLARAPTSIVLADITLLRADAAQTVAARPGLENDRGGTDRDDRARSTTRSPRAGGRGSSTSSRAIAGGARGI